MQNITIREVLVHPSFLWSNSQTTVKRCFSRIIEQETGNNSVDVTSEIKYFIKLYKKHRNKKLFLHRPELEIWLSTKLLPEVSEEVLHSEELLLSEDLLSSPGETASFTLELEETAMTPNKSVPPMASPVTSIPTAASLSDITPVRPNQKSFTSLSISSHIIKLTVLG